jgi:hypothetical protein
MSNRVSGKAAVVTLFVLLLKAMFIVGLTRERANVEHALSTLQFYQMENVCAKDGSGLFVTFESRSAAEQANATVMHCGPCGNCSSDQDIDIYHKTSQSLTKTSTECAFKIFTSGSEGVSQCLTDQVGFTSQCSSCWVENVECDHNACKFTCLWGLLRGEPNNRDADELSDCLKCDEVMCGPGFITCAGANRRRLGITSDIGRSRAEMCSLA